VARLAEQKNPTVVMKLLQALRISEPKIITIGKVWLIYATSVEVILISGGTVIILAFSLASGKPQTMPE
jgi:hypothetical protein